MNEQRRGIIELRESSDRLSPGVIVGRVATWGEWADIGGLFRERINAGALVPEDRVLANVQHMRGRPLAVTGRNGSLEIRSTAGGIDAHIRLPDTQDGRDTATLVREGVLSGLSVEMAVQRDSWNATDRTVQEATFAGIGIVDTPAYPGSVVAEIRSFMTGRLPGSFPRIWV